MNTDISWRELLLWQTVALALWLSACGPVPPPPGPPPSPRVLHMNVSIRTQSGQPIETAAGTLTVDSVEGPGAVVTASGWRQSYTLVEGPTARPGWGATLTVSAPGYLPLASRVVVPDGDGELPEVVLAVAVPPVQRLRVADGRFIAGGKWIVPFFLSEFEAIWLVQHGQLDELRRELDRTVAARRNGIRIFGMWFYSIHRFSPADSDYWVALETVITEAAAKQLYVELVVFCDTAELMPTPKRRRAHFERILTLAQAHPNVLVQIANEARKNGWQEADAPELLSLARLAKARAPDVTLSVSDPLDGGTEGGDTRHNEIQRRLAAAGADYLVEHSDRRDPEDGRFRRWVDHLEGFWDLRGFIGRPIGFIHDEPMGSAAVRQLNRRDNSVVAHTAGACVGAMMGGYTFLKRSEEDNSAPGLMESAVCADIPGSPDFVYINATIAGSPVATFRDFDKCRTISNGADGWVLCYGRREGPVTFREGWRSAPWFELRDSDGVVKGWKAIR